MIIFVLTCSIVDDGPQAKLWLSEISSSRLHFARVASIVDSSTFSDFLRHRPTIHPLENSPPPLSFTITRASFIAILEAAEWAPHNEDARDVMIDDVYIQLAKKLRMLSMDPSIQGQITSTSSLVSNILMYSDGPQSEFATRRLSRVWPMSSTL